MRLCTLSCRMMSSSLLSSKYEHASVYRKKNERSKILVWRGWHSPPSLGKKKNEKQISKLTRFCTIVQIFHSWKVGKYFSSRKARYETTADIWVISPSCHRQNKNKTNKEKQIKTTETTLPGKGILQLFGNKINTAHFPPVNAQMFIIHKLFHDIITLSL